MRKLLIAVGLLLVAAVATGAAMLTASGMPLAWRGSLTRRAYAELALGHLPPMRCVAVRDSAATARDSTFVAPLSSAEGKLRCAGGSAESGARTRMELEDGWVTDVRREWWVSTARGPALADSLSLVASRAGGAPVRCRTEPRPERGDAEERYVYWAPHEGVPFVTELHAWSVTWRMASDGTVMRVPREWYVAIHRHHRQSPCMPA